jgi:excisionase family DNA binding protein
VARLEAPQANGGDESLDTRRAAEYLGIHRDSRRRLAAEGAIPAEQAGAGCKLFFRRSDLDVWRRGGLATVVGIRSRHDG